MRKICNALTGCGLLVLSNAAMAAPPKSHTLRCSYFNVKTDELQDSAKCVVTYSENAKGQFTETYTIKGRVVATITELDRQGQWAAITFNGKVGMRYEQNRYSYEYSPMDLSETLSVSYSH